MRASLLAAGLALLIWVARRANFARILLIVRVAAIWLPALILLELATVMVELGALRLLLGATYHRLKAATWIGGAAASYFSSALLPAGRAAGEVARAALLSPVIGAARAISGAVGLQGCSLVANTVISAIALGSLFTRDHADRRLKVMLALNAAACAALGACVLGLAGHRRIGRWLRRLRVGGGDYPSDAPPSGAPQLTRFLGAIGLCVVARLIQTAQCGISLKAVGLSASVENALGAEGVRLVGSATGDLIPNQLGATEGAYLMFSDTIGAGSDAARSVSISILAHIIQLFVATVSLAVVAATSRQRN